MYLSKQILIEVLGKLIRKTLFLLINILGIIYLMVNCIDLPDQFYLSHRWSSSTSPSLSLTALYYWFWRLYSTLSRLRLSCYGLAATWRLRQPRRCRRPRRAMERKWLASCLSSKESSMRWDRKRHCRDSRECRTYRRIPLAAFGSRFQGLKEKIFYFIWLSN